MRVNCNLVLAGGRAFATCILMLCSTAAMAVYAAQASTPQASTKQADSTQASTGKTTAAPAADTKKTKQAPIVLAQTTPAPSILAKLPHLVLSAGGIVLKIGDEVIGAIGVSGAPGGEKDETCGHAGFDKIKDRLK